MNALNATSCATPLWDHITCPFLPGRMYHLCKRTNEPGTRIVFEEDNYRYFLRCPGKEDELLHKVYAFCMLPDHYHLMVHIWTEHEVLQAEQPEI